MILAVAIVVSMLIAVLRGGRFAALSRLPLRAGWLAVAAFVIQAFFIYQPPTHRTAGGWGWQETLFAASHLLLSAAVLANRHLKGTMWIGLGLLLNLSVMIANGGWMPVTPAAVVQAGHTDLVPSLAPGARVYSSKNIVLLPEETNLQFLSDVFVLPRPFPIPSVFSIGDVCIALGALLLIQDAMLKYRDSEGTYSGGKS
jgi:hypothetical protein